VCPAKPLTLFQIERQKTMTTTKTKRRNKYTYVHVLQGHYGQGWEDLTQSESRREMRQNLKEYRENEGGAYRIIFRRELNEEK
jgi:hypothetical protein